MEKEFDIHVYGIMQTSVPAGRHEEDGVPAGDTIRKLILDHWDTHEKINVFFEGIAKMTRPFIDEAFAKILETRTLDEFNSRLHFPDASDHIVKALNEAVKLRLKIIKAAKEREEMGDGF